ncbi:hypothetical protein Pan44_03110 [Caulifigura coniformis]|uniref:DUF1573 domain-containing protein n=1 Tax=Caulifigura coniformis TaxID=2527983 RepID=A0A517S867_9PLAN|nr:DUF1573 domain-containing protein [Caulifigura coniformis]QDT52302.1 hypothetical protein Pan44_03110 [Caulifigura coniformis]
MKPIAVIGAIITIGLALFVVSKLTAPTNALNEVAVEPPPPPVETPTETETKLEEGGEEKPEGTPEEKPAEDVSYQSNPFDLKKPGPYPKAVLVQERFEFGSMALGATKSHPFVVKNEGDAPLKLEKGPLQCKCTMPALKDKEIPPGGQAEIVLEWKPLAVQAGFEKEATIWTNDPANPRLSLQIFGDVVSDDFWEPVDGFSLDQLKQGEARTVTGFIGSRTRDDLKIERVDQVNNLLKIEYTPADEAKLKEKEAKVGYNFTLTLPPSEEISLVRETVTVTVNSATNTQIIWPVTGNRIGPVSIIGPGWYAEKQLVQLGHFRAAKGTEKKFTMLLTDRGEKPLEITDVKVDGPIQVALERDEKWPVKTNERYFLTVKFIPNSPIGVHNTDNAIPVTITTNHPKVPTISFNVSYDAD